MIHELSELKLPELERSWWMGLNSVWIFRLYEGNFVSYSRYFMQQSDLFLKTELIGVWWSAKHRVSMSKSIRSHFDSTEMSHYLRPRVSKYLSSPRELIARVLCMANWMRRKGGIGGQITPTNRQNWAFSGLWGGGALWPCACPCPAISPLNAPSPSSPSSPLINIHPSPLP